MRHGVYHGRTGPVERAYPHSDEHVDGHTDQHGNGYGHAERHANEHGNGYGHAERHANEHGDGYRHANADTYRDLAALYPDAHAYARIQPNIHQHAKTRTAPANIYTNSAAAAAATAGAYDTP